MYCYKCGHKLEDDANVCIECGTKVIKDTNNKREENVSFERSSSRENDKLSFSCMWCIVVENV